VYRHVPTTTSCSYGQCRKRLKKLRILVVDDNIDAAHMLKMLLEALEHEVIVENESHSELKRALDERPDVVLLDIGLPQMDGYEIARRLRTMQSDSRSTLIAATGYGQESDLEKAKEAGFDHHLIKPIDANALRTISVS
jgi:CheY-like chemotaxis protein